MQLCYQTVLFDFDGTLCASGEGIMSCVALALQEMHYPALPPETLRRFVGPPAEQAYQLYCGMTKEEAEEAVRHFRTHYNTGGWRKSKVYSGIPELLRDLKRAGAIVCTASSKPRIMVETMLKYFQILQYFDGLSAADDDDGNADKVTVIRHALKLCSTENLTDTVMIGDTHFDVEGAREVGLPFIGVSYGYGGEKDLKSSGAVRIASSPNDLRQYLFQTT